MPQLVFLGCVLAAFAAFALTLLGVSIYAAGERPAPEPIDREVTPAKRAAS